MRYPLAHPVYGPILMAKFHNINGFYRNGLNIDDIPNLALHFPLGQEMSPSSPSSLCCPRDGRIADLSFRSHRDIADLANQRIQSNHHPAPHHLDNLAESVTPDETPS